MTEYKRIGIDTSKAVFTLHGIDQQDRPVLRINLRRAQMIAFFKKVPPTVVALEACGSSHYWAHELIALGHTVRLIPPQYVKPYVKSGKNDRNDAEAICEAAGRPGMHFVPAKSVTQQAQGMVLKMRETLVGQRTALINTVRGHAAEFGVIAGKGAGKIVPLLSAIEQEVAIPPRVIRFSTPEPPRPPRADVRRSVRSLRPLCIRGAGSRLTRYYGRRRALQARDRHGCVPDLHGS
jgi:transposase